MNAVDWYGCYDGSWQSAPLVAEAYAHPAKVSFNLAERIYRHMLAEGWLQPGDYVLDPFGGIGGFAFHAALYGMRWVGVELEQRFVDLGQQNLELWRTRYAPHFPGYGTARLLQGDSRRLVEVVTGAAGVVSSPPYAATVNQSDGANDADARLTRKADAGVDVTQAVNRGGPNSVLNKPQAYGSTPGQLGNMPAGVVSSPPYEGSVSGDGERKMASLKWDVGARAGMSNDGMIKRMTEQSGAYGVSDGNIGNDTANTFWSAAAAIVQQCYAILRPGGYAAWVTGDFVRNKQRVPFGQQWLDLCVACGFEPVLWAVAWKSEHNGTQAVLFGETQELRKEKVSFFRRLANQKNPDAAIANEDVLFMRKPL